jgi:SWI/SNF-related matrix-associated actin-dependent regulator of chromatin subfamily A-like protein 1
MSLYPYQLEGARFLAERERGYLADGMGLGKTVQACHATKLVRPKSVCVIAPASTLPNWYREWRTWGHAPAVFGAASYNKLTQQPHLFSGRDWDVVILDEAHYTKTRGAARTVAALTFARAAKRAWLLSATPMPNHPGELWAPIRALWPGVPRRLGVTSYREWLDMFCRWSNTPYGPKVWGSRNGSKLRPYLDRILMRRRLEEIGLQLPPLRVDVHLLEETAELRRALQAFQIDPEQLEGAMAAEEGEDGSLSRLRRLLGTYKAARIAEILAEELRTEQYRKVVVMCHHRDTMAALSQALDSFGVRGFDGSLPVMKRQEQIDDFTLDPSVRVMIVQQQAGGVGINLQVASEIVLVEPSWSPAENAQAIKRIHRIGSTDPCRARIFAVAGTLDEAVMEVTARKTRMAAELGLEP